MNWFQTYWLDLNDMRQPACLVNNPITVDNFVALLWRVFASSLLWSVFTSSLLWSVYLLECVVMYVDDFDARNKCLAAKLLKQGYRYRKLRKVFYKFYRHNVLVSNVLAMI